MEARLLAAAVQLAAGPDKRENLAKAENLVRRAGELGARLVVLPELLFWRGPTQEEARVAETVPGPTADFLAALARSMGIVLVAGSILETHPANGKPFNTALVFDSQGVLRAKYRKIHLFDVEIPGRVVVRESERRTAGKDVVTCETEVGRIGVAICYDLRFPELFRRLGADGAEIACMPSAFTFATGEAHWEVLVRARAIENQVYFIAANQVGAGPSGIVDYGNSMIVDPWGRVVARASDEEGVILAQLNGAYLKRVREELPCGEHIRLIP